MSQVAHRTASAVAALQGLKAGLQNVRASLPTSMTDALLKMGKDGIWVYGAENIEVEAGALWAINPMSIRHGYACWTNYDVKEKKKNELLGEVMVLAGQAKPLKSDLSDLGWDWADQISFSAMCLNGEDKGTQVLYKTTSVGGINAVGKVLDALVAQLDKDPDHPVPVIELDTDSYTHKQWGKTYVPIMVIKRWMELTDTLPDMDAPETEDVKEAATTAAAEAAPARRRGAAAAQQAEQPAAPAATAQSEAAGSDQPRRRRRAA
jgi:hypothetical protein